MIEQLIDYENEYRQEVGKYLHFAFGKQFDELIKKLEVEENELVCLGGGGYVKKVELKDFLKKSAEMKSKKENLKKELKRKIAKGDFTEDDQYHYLKASNFHVFYEAVRV